jgi:hypothetical protein
MSMLASASFCGSTFSPPPKEARKWPLRSVFGPICVPLCRDLAQGDNDNDNRNDNNNNNNNVLVLLLCYYHYCGCCCCCFVVVVVVEQGMLPKP